jgi:hypothetical protein
MLVKLDGGTAEEALHGCNRRLNSRPENLRQVSHQQLTAIEHHWTAAGARSSTSIPRTMCAGH